jgi:hypothetical protein
MSSLFERAAPSSSPEEDGRHDFDFFVGRWSVAHRRLRRRLAGDTRWDEFAGISEMRQIVGGLAHVDDNILQLPAATYRAATVRVFNPGTGLWSIWWIDGRNPQLEPPVHGRFQNGVGTFLGDDLFEGRPIRVRFVWSEITARSARWEQAFSADGGAGWETNWIMRFTRRA